MLQLHESRQLTEHITSMTVERFSQLSPSKRRELMSLMTPKWSKYIKNTPYPKQQAFLLLPHKEAFYGGAAGGGKSDALLMCALQYVDVPGYSAIIFRRSYADLMLRGALIDRSKTWLAPFIDTKEVKWKEKDKKFIFPSGATLQFGFLDNPNDIYKYQGGEYQFMGFDELTQLREESYRYMFSRLRKTLDLDVPLRVRSASNPGGFGHEWVKERFVISRHPDRIFIPANVYDNKNLDAEEYLNNLGELDEVTKAQLANGDWDVKRLDAIFRRIDFRFTDSIPYGARMVRYWDFAGTTFETQSRGNKHEPDYTVGLLLAYLDGFYYIVDIQRFRGTPFEVETRIKMTAELDGRDVPIFIEREPGSQSIHLIDHYKKNVLTGFYVQENPTGQKNKMRRADPVSSAVERGLVFIVTGGLWIPAFLEEAEVFPGDHDDQIDALSGAFQVIDKSKSLFTGSGTFVQPVVSQGYNKWKKDF